MRTLRRPLGIPAVLTVVALMLACTGDDSPTNPVTLPPVEGIEGAELFDWAVGPIEGFTTAWHPTPPEFSVPVGTTLWLKCGGSTTDAQWTNATEIMRGTFGSIAEVRVTAAGRIEIHADTQSSGGGPKGRRDPTGLVRHTCVVHGVDITPGDVYVKSLKAWTPPLTVSAVASNYETMRLFRASSVAACREVAPGRYRTSVGQFIQFDVALSDPRFASIIETRASGQRPQLAQNARQFISPGTYTVSAGLGSNHVQLRIETYSVTITDHRIDRDVEANTDKVRFKANTTPPGFENEITWLSSTRSGRAEPVVGKGAEFEIVLTDVFDEAPAPGLKSRWFGVRADNAIFTNDVICPTDTCAFFASWEKNKQGGATPAAPNYVPLPGSGTTQGDINWLISWDNSPDPGNIGESVCGLASCFGDGMYDSEKAAIVATCQAQTGAVAQALCAGQQVRALLQTDPDNVCRHHAIALESVLECLGISAGLECAWMGIEGHAWVEITVSGTRYLLDAYNSIYICCQ